MTIKLQTLIAAATLLLASGAHANGFDITNQMNPGWNLGNSLDATGGDETYWGNPKTTKAMIDTVKKAGFKSLRVPVSWDDHYSGSSYTIDNTWMNRVEEVVNYGLANGMYVIVNLHHTTSSWEDLTAANETSTRNRLTKLWTQIGTRFKGYDNHLIFEVMNEPRVGNDWNGKSEYYGVLNRHNAALLTLIRGQGGNNATRLVMLPTYAASGSDAQTSAMVVPNDSNVAISIHNYSPYSFALDGAGTKTFTDTATLDKAWATITSRFISKNIPVVLGEWASYNKNNESERIKHADYFVRGAVKANVPTLLWDNGSSSTMGYLNRKALTWYYPNIIDTIMKASNVSGSSSSASSSRASSSATSSATSSSASSRASSSSSSASGGTPPLSGTGDYPTGFSKCAELGGTCNVSKGTGWVAFGRKGKWVAKNVGVGNSIACTVAAFGSDPGGAPNKCSTQN